MSTANLLSKKTFFSDLRLEKPNVRFYIIFKIMTRGIQKNAFHIQIQGIRDTILV